jgi:hypothetical protein
VTTRPHSIATAHVSVAAGSHPRQRVAQPESPGTCTSAAKALELAPTRRDARPIPLGPSPLGEAYALAMGNPK